MKNLSNLTQSRHSLLANGIVRHCSIVVVKLELLRAVTLQSERPARCHVMYHPVEKS